MCVWLAGLITLTIPSNAKLCIAFPLPAVILSSAPNRVLSKDSLSDICKVTERGSLTVALYNNLLIVKNWVPSIVASKSICSANKSALIIGIN